MGRKKHIVAIGSWVDVAKMRGPTSLVVQKTRPG